MPKLIVGLGNPGSEYENTYHNIGFAALDALAVALGKKIDKADCSAQIAVFSRACDNIILAKPTTYMNLSGVAVKGIMAKFGVPPQNTVVIYDDIDIPRFALRARKNGSAGTHNGMKSVLKETGRDDIARIRIGIGRGEGDLAAYVLSKTAKADKEQFDQVLAAVADALAKYIADDDFDALTRTLNNNGISA